MHFSDSDSFESIDIQQIIEDHYNNQNSIQHNVSLTILSSKVCSKPLEYQKTVVLSIQSNRFTPVIQTGDEEIIHKSIQGGFSQMDNVEKTINTISDDETKVSKISHKSTNLNDFQKRELFKPSDTKYLHSFFSNVRFNHDLFRIHSSEDTTTNDNPIDREEEIEKFIKDNTTLLGLKRQRRARKYKPDDIRKKIKARFHKTLRKLLNEQLKNAQSALLFDFLPQCFLCNISKEKNKNVMQMRFIDLLSKDFIKEEGENYKKKKIDYCKYTNNLEVLDYLKKNPEISKNSGFDELSKKTYAEILNDYFNSKDFDESIQQLKNENEDEDYIREYILKAKHYVKFFSGDSNN